jgi:hypothetical protein
VRGDGGEPLVVNPERQRFAACQCLKGIDQPRVTHRLGAHTQPVTVGGVEIMFVCFLFCGVFP